MAGVPKGWAKRVAAQQEAAVKPKPKAKKKKKAE